MIEDFVTEYRRYRSIGELALGQMSDAALNRVPAPDGDSAAMLVRHVGGNLASRFTDFLTSDGEKPWRDRDAEFETRAYGRAEMDGWWRRGWDALDEQLASLTDADLARTVLIRGQPLTVHAALARSLAHAAHHVGQLVVLARETADARWEWISIPKHGSAAYNLRPDRETGPR